jgi:hypothetical protein
MGKTTILPAKVRLGVTPGDKQGAITGFAHGEEMGTAEGGSQTRVRAAAGASLDVKIV